MLRRHSIPLLVAILAVGLRCRSGALRVVALVPVYWLAVDRGLRAALVAGALIVVTQVVWMTLWEEPASMAVLVAGTIATGRYMVLRRAAAERERELLAEAATTEERLRIARELHDAVGHDVALMVVQAEALAAVTGDERADAIATLGRHTMGELHRTLNVLRDEAPTQPSPSVADLGAVLEGARAAGVPITLAVEGAPRTLPATLDASAYRIVQEAVTNVIRHAHGAPAAVTVHYGDHALHLTVTDEGTDAPTKSDGGHGLIGMRERVAAFGGTLTAGPGEHGYAVHAELPTPHDPRPDRRRSAADAHGLQDRARGHGPVPGDRRGRRRPPGDRAGGEAQAGRDPDGHPHARPGRDRGDPAAPA